jgi:hypothetical protein
MQYIGRLEQNYLEIIRGVHTHYKDANRDLSIAKSIILQFIMKNHATHLCHSIYADDYKLNISKLHWHKGLKFELKNKDDISYHICIKTGSVIFTIL